MKHREKALELEGRFKDAEAAQDEAGCEENNYRSHCEPQERQLRMDCIEEKEMLKKCAQNAERKVKRIQEELHRATQTQNTEDMDININTVKAMHRLYPDGVSHDR